MFSTLDVPEETQGLSRLRQHSQQLYPIFFGKPGRKPEILVPFAQLPWFSGFLLVRSAHPDPLTVKNAVQEAIWSVSPDIAESRAEPMTAMIEGQISEPRLYALLLGCLCLHRAGAGGGRDLQRHRIFGRAAHSGNWRPASVRCANRRDPEDGYWSGYEVGGRWRCIRPGRFVLADTTHVEHAIRS